VVFENSPIPRSGIVSVIKNERSESPPPGALLDRSMSLLLAGEVFHESIGSLLRLRCTTRCWNSISMNSTNSSGQGLQCNGDEDDRCCCKEGHGSYIGLPHLSLLKFLYQTTKRFQIRGEGRANLNHLFN
jgi:hypothetical protein